MLGVNSEEAERRGEQEIFPSLDITILLYDDMIMTSEKSNLTFSPKFFVATRLGL